MPNQKDRQHKEKATECHHFQNNYVAAATLTRSHATFLTSNMQTYNFKTSSKVASSFQKKKKKMRQGKEGGRSNKRHRDGKREAQTEIEQEIELKRMESRHEVCSVAFHYTLMLLPIILFAM